MSIERSRPTGARTVTSTNWCSASSGRGDHRFIVRAADSAVRRNAAGSSCAYDLIEGFSSYPPAEGLSRSRIDGARHGRELTGTVDAQVIGPICQAGRLEGRRDSILGALLSVLVNDLVSLQARALQLGNARADRIRL